MTGFINVFNVTTFMFLLHKQSNEKNHKMLKIGIGLIRRKNWQLKGKITCLRMMKNMVCVVKYCKIVQKDFYPKTSIGLSV